MELDDMILAWKDLDRRTAEQAVAVDAIRRQQGVSKVQTSLRRFLFAPLWDLAWGVFAMGLLGNLLAKNLHELAYFVPAALLDLAALATVISAGYQLSVVACLDFAGPVVESQKALARIRVARIRTVQYLLLSSPLLWVLMMTVAWKALTGGTVSQAFGTPWFLANLVFGLAFFPLAWWVCKNIQIRFGSSRFLTQLADDVAGRSLTKAMKQFEDLKQFCE